MNLLLENSNMREYLKSDKYVDYNNPIITEKATRLFYDCKDEIDKIKIAFEFVRDQISHSWDIQSKRITKTASEVLHYKEGICYAKSMLLAALLRYERIPTGFCYQKLTLGNTIESGYCIHALNTVYISSLNKWIRIDARGNTNGIDAQFFIDKEQLAFIARLDYNEIDYPIIYTNPAQVTVETLESNTDCIEMIMHRLPVQL
jgi:transglutaminase-like putative cysteine protease